MLQTAEDAPRPGATQGHPGHPKLTWGPAGRDRENCPLNDTPSGITWMLLSLGGQKHLGGHTDRVTFPIIPTLSPTNYRNATWGPQRHKRNPKQSDFSLTVMCPGVCNMETGGVTRCSGVSFLR